MIGSFVPVRPATSTAPAPPTAISDLVGPEPSDVGPARSDRAPTSAGRSLPALGVLARFAEDAGVTDLLVDGRGALWRDAGHGLQLVDSFEPLDRPGARRLAVALVAAGGRHIDDATPCVDVRVAGARVHAALPPVSTGGALVSIRLPRTEPWRLAALRDMLDAEQEGLLLDCVRRRRNLLICGPAGSGKTSLLAALLAEAPAAERILTIEDVAELAIDHPHVVGLEARQPNSDGAGGIGVAALVREALRMRPDRLVVGECRGAEVVELLTALNTGHDGGAGTVHCTDPEGLGARLEALGALGGLDPVALRSQALAAIDVVVQLERTARGRRVQRIGRLASAPDGSLRVVDL